MPILVSLSKRSKKLLAQLNKAFDDPSVHRWNEQANEAIERADLVAWLMQNIEHDKKSRFLLESCRVALLKDLHNSFLSPEERKASKKPATPWSKKIKFLFLLLAGTLFSVSDGFDGVASLLGSVTSIPTTIICAVGVTFALLSVVTFYSFSLLDISKKIGVNFINSKKLLDVFLKQVEQINQIKKTIDDHYADETVDNKERQAFRQMLAMLAERYKALDEARAAYLKALNTPALKVAKIITAGMSAVIFFSAGFCAGQTISVTIAGLFLASVSPTFWPIILASSLVGLASLSLYWFVQRPEIENLVSRCLGLNKEHIDEFTNEDEVKQQKEALQKLDHKLARYEQLHQRAAQMAANEDIPNQPQGIQHTVIEQVVPSINRHTFFTPNDPLSRGRERVREKVDESAELSTASHRFKS